MTYYLGTVDPHDKTLDELVFEDNVFSEVIHFAVEEYGRSATFVVYYGGPDAGGADYEVAYHDGSDIGRLYIVEPDDVPMRWRPGSEGGDRLTPELAPESIRAEQPLVATSERGLRYPAVLQTLDNFEDLSYGNDVTDSVGFTVGRKAYVVFVEPARVIGRSAEAREAGHSRYMLMETVWDGRSAEIDWQVTDAVYQTDSPDELAAHVLEMDRTAGGDPIERRMRLLDMEKTSKVTYVEPEQTPISQRAALLELNGRRRRRNPASAPDRDAAVAKYAEFHRFDPKKLEHVKDAKIPTHVYRAGKAKWVTYRSKKTDPETGKRPSRPIDYIHEHDAGVEVYLAKKSEIATERVEVPSEFAEAKALVYLGINLGFCFVTEDGDELEAQSTDPMPELWATPDGRCLLVIQSRREVIAMEWGGALGVFARGIDG